jgi:glycoside/pentoside/hexuronide:cation symporter, GPH family
MKHASNLLSRKTKLMYGAGDAGINLADTMVGLLFAIFLTDVVGLRPGLAALSVFIGRSSDYINDPIIGYLSDRTRTRWGRRRPFILFGAVPFAAIYMLLWWVPPLQSQISLAIYYGAVFILYDTAATVLYMPYFALTPELSSDYDERTSLTSYRMAFSIIGAMIAFIVPLAIIGPMTAGNASRVFSVGVCVALISILPMYLVFFGTREKTEYLTAPKTGLKESLGAAFRNKPFLYAIGIFLATWTALDIVQATLLYFLKHRMGVRDQEDVVFGLLFIAALLSLPFWDWAAKHWDKKRAYIGGMGFLTIVLICFGLLPPQWGFVSILIAGFLAGIGLGAVQVLPWAMIPDVIEWDELKTGTRHEGMFYSLVTLFRKIASSLSLPLLLLILEWTGYSPGAIQQPRSAVIGIQLLMGPIPAAFLVLGIVCAFFYPLGREAYADIRWKIDMRAGAETKTGGRSNAGDSKMVDRIDQADGNREEDDAP